MALLKEDYLIDDSNYTEVLAVEIDGKPMGKGYVERDYDLYPDVMFATPPAQLVGIPRSDWSARIKEKEEQKSRLSDIRATMPSLDQGRRGYCWTHSVASCHQLMQLLSNSPFVPVSAYAVACKIKNFADQGGWCGLAAKFMEEQGVPSAVVWPQLSVDRALDNPATWADAAKRKITESWYDVGRAVHAQRLTFDQVISLLLSNIPCALDFNWWGHSVCGMDAVEVEPGSFGIRILNSWSDAWGSRGTGVLRGSQAIPDGAIGLRRVALAA